ncbi:GrpB family protein [Alkalicoccobacillus gibsonii]|uniref:GrpB family protein n=1 Tax=Alkalicoccobacillus gibsonii TaxID=79881 RepID=UPI0019330130|nr:GrpB family protein [Alkalicoccobacillus gibsonii]MBM0064160.1 GrpB family protein [Alkalicoccobacillus gibsonii]
METFKLKSVDQTILKRMVQKHTLQIQQLIPNAEIHHVGSTAVPNALTKGDIDLQIRVKQKNFLEAKRLLLSRYELNTGSSQTSFFSAFEIEDELPIGVQLTVINSEIDHFWKVTEFFKANPTIQEEYNQLKKAYNGQPMDKYRTKKSEFIEKILYSEAFLHF